MPLWSLLLSYFKGDLADVAWWCQAPSLLITHSISGYHLTSTEFEEMDDPEAVYSLAQERIAQLNGIGRLLLPDYHPIELAPSVTRVNDDGTSRVWVFPRAYEPRPKFREEASSASKLIPATQVNEWLAAGRSSLRLTEALRMFGTERHDWVGLYKIMEIIRAEVKPSIDERGWATKSELRRFSQTANSAEAVGDGSRHSPGKFGTPRQPITLMEATNLIGRLLRHWIESAIPTNTNTNLNVP